MTDVSAFLDKFEQNGATLSRPVLPEGNYKGNIEAIASRINDFVYKRGKNKGKEGTMISWQVRIALESLEAQNIMKQDGDVNVYADGDTTTLGNGSLNVEEGIGIAMDNNAAFWGFVGAIFEQVDMATKQKDDSGAVTYKIDRGILEGIYANLESAEAEYRNSEDFKEERLPYVLAEKELANLSELITGESDTRPCYVELSRRANFRDKTVQEHFVKAIKTVESFESIEGNIDTVIG